MGHACCGAKYTKHLKDCPNREGGAAKKLKYVCIDCDHTMKVTEPPAACEKCGKPNIVQK